MKKLVACVSVLCLMFSSMSSLIFEAMPDVVSETTSSETTSSETMSSDQLALYNAAIRQQDVERTLKILRSGTVDLNKKFLNLEGKKTTFLHELVRVAIKKLQLEGGGSSSFYETMTGTILEKGINVYLEEPKKSTKSCSSICCKKVLLPSLVSTINTTVVPAVFKCVKRRISVEESVKFSHNILMLIKLFIGFGANLDLADDSHLSARDLLIMSNVRGNKEIYKMIKMLINPPDDISSLITEVKGEISRPSESKRCRTCCKRCRKSMHTKCE